jgi:hypothetical protein
VLTSQAFPEPGVYGIWRPILLLPAGITEQLTAAQLEAILAHELCHVRRRDNLATAMHMVVEAVFWFHPLVWWLGARLMEERERACDEDVLRMGNDPQVYAEGILRICELYLESPLRCVAGVTGANLKRRIEAIMANRTALRLNFGKKATLAIGATATLAGPVLIGVMVGIGHLPAVRAQSLVAFPSQAQAAQTAPLNAPASVPAEAPPQHLDALTSFDPVASQNPHDALVVSGTLPRVFAPYGLSEDEYSRRLAFADANLGPRQSPLRQMVIRYGPPDHVDDLNWRYNYLPAYHGALEMELIGSTRNLQSVRILSPSPVATYESAPGDTTLSAPLAETLDVFSRRWGQSEPVPANAIAGFRGGHASMQVYPAGAYSVLTVPLGSLSGQVYVVGRIQARADTSPDAIRSLAGVAQASIGMYSDGAILDAGSFVCDLVVKEVATGKIYKETIDFEVK